jgi:hypothetical protein
MSPLQSWAGEGGKGTIREHPEGCLIRQQVSYTHHLVGCAPQVPTQNIELHVHMLFVLLLHANRLPVCVGLSVKLLHLFLRL